MRKDQKTNKQNSVIKLKRRERQYGGDNSSEYCSVVRIYVKENQSSDLEIKKSLGMGHWGGSVG